MIDQIKCSEVIFSFNRKHLEDSSIPMWILKTGGNSYYCNHVICNKGWITKETPDNPHTKGSIKIRNCTLSIENEVATIDDLVPP